MKPTHEASALRAALQSFHVSKTHPDDARVDGYRDSLFRLLTYDPADCTVPPEYCPEALRTAISRKIRTIRIMDRWLKYLQATPLCPGR